MARTGVGYMDIARAAEALKARGEEPTVDRVRAELGTGSKSTIAPLLKRWRTEVEGGPVETGGLPRELVDALKSLYEQIQAQAEADIQTVREECEAAVGNLEQELSSLKQTLSARSGELEDMEQKLQASTEEGQSLQQQLAETRVALEKSEFQREEGAARIVELKTTVAEMKEENRQIREHFEHFQQRTAEDRQLERDQARLAADQLRHQMAGLGEQLTQANRKLTDGDAQLARAEIEIRELDTERQAAMQEASACKAQIEALESRAVEQQRLLDDKAAEVVRVSERLSISEVRNTSVVREIEFQHALTAKLEGELGSEKEKLEVLRQENRMILQEKALLQGQFNQLERSLSAAAAE